MFELDVITIPQKECQTTNDSNSQILTLTHVPFSHYVLSLKWLINFITSNQHKDIDHLHKVIFISIFIGCTNYII
jgi:hypothetical protein